MTKRIHNYISTELRTRQCERMTVIPLILGATLKQLQKNNVQSTCIIHPITVTVIIDRNGISDNILLWYPDPPLLGSPCTKTIFHAIHNEEISL